MKLNSGENTRAKQDTNKWERQIKSRMTLEPRLQEYLKKLSYFRKNNVTPSIGLETEFTITREDKFRIREYLRGNKDIYGKDFVVPEQVKDTFNGWPTNDTKNTSPFQIQYDDYKKDPRYERLQKKIQRDKDANMGRYSYAGRNLDELDELKKVRNNISGIQTLSTALTDPNDNKLFLDDEPYMSDYLLNVDPKPNDRIYTHTQPEIQYRQRLHWSQNEDGRGGIKHNHNTQKLEKDLAQYKKHVNMIYNDPNSKFDMDYSQIHNDGNRTNMMMRSSKTNQAVPLNSKNVNLIGGTRDIDIDNELHTGIPERNARAKSLGYPNYVEHSFDYISPDIQDPRHVVMPYPQNTRALNSYLRSKTQKRDIY